MLKTSISFCSNRLIYKFAPVNELTKRKENDRIDWNKRRPRLDSIERRRKMSVKAVKKATKIKAEKDMYAAFGWLAKEGKLAFEEIEGELFVALI